MAASMTLRGLGDALEVDARLREGFVQQLEGVEIQDLPIRKQGGEGRETNRVRISRFRVVLYADIGKAMADETKPTLREALHAAYSAVKLEVPAAIAEAFPPPEVTPPLYDPLNPVPLSPNFRVALAGVPKTQP